MSGDNSGPRGFGILGANTVRILLGTLVTFILIVFVSLVAFWYQGCPKGGFRCGDGACLPRNMWCDNVPDCLGGEDESAENCLLPPGQNPELIKELLDSMPTCDLCVCPQGSDLADCEPQPVDHTSLSECSTRIPLPGSSRHTLIRNERRGRFSDPMPSIASHVRLQRSVEGDQLHFGEDKMQEMVRYSAEHLGVSRTANPHQSENMVGYRNTDVWSENRNTSFHSSDLLKNGTTENQGKPQNTNDYIFSKIDLLKKGRGFPNRKIHKGDKSSGEPTSTLSTASRTLASATVPDVVALRPTQRAPLVRHSRFALQKETLSSEGHFQYKSKFLPNKNASRAAGNYNGAPKRETGDKEKREAKQLLHYTAKITSREGQCKQRSGDCRVKRRERRFLSVESKTNVGEVLDQTKRKLLSHGRQNTRYRTVTTENQDGSISVEGDFGGKLLLDMRRVENQNGTGGDFEESLESEINDCCCEYSSQLKCLGKDITRIPSRVVGNVTWFIVTFSSLRELDANVMAQYSSLKIMSLEENLLASVPRGVFSKQNRLEHLYMSKNNIKYLHKDSCLGLRNLRTLFIDKNRLNVVELSCLIHTPALTTLNLAYNSLTLKHQRFPPLSNLHHVFLHDNKISNIDSLFKNITSIMTLQLNNNRIRKVHHGAFASLENLQSIDLSGNPLTTVQDIFKSQKALRVLNLMDLNLRDIHERHFISLEQLKLAYFKSFRYCSYVPRVLQCLPSTDGVSNGRDMMGWVVLRGAVWVVASLTLAGNVAVIGCRAISKEDNKILKLFIKNLAAADLLMGVYLVILGVQDLKTRGSFQAEALAWASSHTCTFTGILGLVSSETSVFILTFMSLERYLFIRQPLGARTLSESSARICLLFIWLTSVFLAVFPAIWIKGFYGSGAMCLPLHVTEPYLAGWQYSTFIFLGINTLSMAVILGAYAGLFFNIMVTRTSTPLSGGESKFALRFFFIVVTNCVCWLPIACVKAAALANIEVHSGVYAWLVVLVLPINSAVNPILYTFSTSKFQSQLATAVTIFRKARNRQDSDTDVLRYSSSRSWGSAAQYIVAHAHLPPLHAHNASQNGSVALVRCDKKLDQLSSAVCVLGKKRSLGDTSDAPKDSSLSRTGVGCVSPDKDSSVAPQLTLSAKVRQVRSPLEETHTEARTNSFSRGHMPPIKLEVGARQSYCDTDTSCRGKTDVQNSTIGQGYQDFCLEAHVSSHKNGRPSTDSKPSESPSSFEGAPLYVGCSATTSSDCQDTDVLRLNLTVCYSPDSRCSPVRSVPINMNSSDPVDTTDTNNIAKVKGTDPQILSNSDFASLSNSSSNSSPESLIVREEIDPP